MQVTASGTLLSRGGDSSQSCTFLGADPVIDGVAVWMVRTRASGSCIVGVAQRTANVNKWLGSDSHGWGMDGSDGQKCHGGRWRPFGPKFGANATVRVKLDMNRHTLEMKVSALQCWWL